MPGSFIGMNQILRSGLVESLGSSLELGFGLLDVTRRDRFADGANALAKYRLCGAISRAAGEVLAKVFLGTGVIRHDEATRKG